MFTKTKQLVYIPAIAKKCLLNQVKSLDSVKYFSTKSSIQYDFPKDYR